MKSTKNLLIVPFVLVMGWLSRMAGGAPIKLPYGLDQWLIAAPYAVAGALYGGWLGGIASFLTAFLGKRTGHGQWMDLGHYTKVIKPEKLDKVVQLFAGPDINETQEGPGSYYRDFIGLCVSGVFMHLGLAVTLIGADEYFPAFIVLIGGLSKSIAYAIGWWLEDRGYLEKAPRYLNEATAIGEFLFGVFSACCIVPVLFFIEGFAFL